MACKRRDGRPYTALFVLLFLPACAHAIHNKSHEILLQNSEYGRRANFTRFMSGESCGSVTRTFCQGVDDQSGMAFWNITCSNGKSYVVTIDADDSTRILDCERYEATGLFRCFTTFEDRVDELKRLAQPKPPRFPGDLPPAVLRHP